MVDGRRAADRSGPFGVFAIVVVGVALGLGYNTLGLRSAPAFGLAWLARDKAADVFVLEESAVPPDGSAAAEGGSGGTVSTDDPLAAMLGQQAAAAPAAAGLPEIPDLPRPIQMQLPMVAKFFEAGAALFVDAREASEFEEGHVPGAVNLPFDEAVTDPAALEAIPALGRPIIVYCGGGTCELSINLAWELLAVGHTRVTYFQGGWPEWVENGLPVESGAGGGGA